MFVNKLFSLFKDPAKGWDPVSVSYAEEYASFEWGNIDLDIVDELEGWLGGFEGKRVLDLGGGPGHYTAEFARRGAVVVWHDVSQAYRDIVQSKMREEGLNAEFSLGYLEEARKFTDQGFDLVFNRLCWYYGQSDRSFGQLIFDLVAEGGVAYVDTTNTSFLWDSLNSVQKLRVKLNQYLRLKVGHPYPPKHRVAKQFLTLGVERICVDYSNDENDRVLFRKRRA